MTGQQRQGKSERGMVCMSSRKTPTHRGISESDFHLTPRLRRPRFPKAISAIVAAGAVCMTQVAPAEAQSDTRVAESNGSGIDAHLFRPAVDSRGFFTVNGADILPGNNISFGLVL